MSRILFWLGLVFLVMFAIRSKFRDQRERHDTARRQQGAAPSPQPGRAVKAAADAETMLCCAHCGIYYPASESVRAEGRDFCSAAHARLPAA